MTLQAQIIKEKGSPVFAVLPYEQYEILNNYLSDFDNMEDFFDYINILKVKSETQKWYSLVEVKQELGI